MTIQRLLTRVNINGIIKIDFIICFRLEFGIIILDYFHFHRKFLIRMFLHEVKIR
jgi:hypothetical protein